MVWSWQDRNGGREPRQVSSRQVEEAGMQGAEMLHFKTVKYKTYCDETEQKYEVKLGVAEERLEEERKMMLSDARRWSGRNGTNPWFVRDTNTRLG